MMIEYIHESLVNVDKNDDILTLTTKNKPNIIIKNFTQIIQDKLKNNEYITKSLDRCKNRELKIYKINTDYSIITFTNCKQFLIVSSYKVNQFCNKLSLEIAHGRMKNLSLRYGLYGEKMLGIEIYNNDKPISCLKGVYYTLKSAPAVGIYGNNHSERYEDDFYQKRSDYFDYIDKFLYDFKTPNKEYLSNKIVLKLVAMKLTNSCGEAYGMLSTVIRLIASGYRSTLSEEKFRRTLHLLSHPEYIAKRRQIISKLKMEVVIDE